MSGEQVGDLEGALGILQQVDELVIEKEKKNKEDSKPAVPRQAKNEYKAFAGHLLFLLRRDEELLQFLETHKK